MAFNENTKDLYFAKVNDKLSVHILFDHSVTLDTIDHSLFLKMYPGYPDPILLSFFYSMGYYFILGPPCPPNLGSLQGS